VYSQPADVTTVRFAAGYIVRWRDGRARAPRIPQACREGAKATDFDQW